MLLEPLMIPECDVEQVASRSVETELIIPSGCAATLETYLCLPDLTLKFQFDIRVHLSKPFSIMGNLSRNRLEDELAWTNFHNE